VVKARTFFFDTDNFPALLGRDRLGGDLAIAIDPRKADRVYLVWGDVIEGHPALHVIRSDNGGTKWSRNLCTVKKAKNPGLAVTTNGTLGFLYQQVVKSEGGEETWITNLERTKDDFRNVDTRTLARFPVTEVKLDNGQPQLGDYLRLMAAGNAFYGIFPASNVPDLSRFCCGVTFQRPADKIVRAGIADVLNDRGVDVAQVDEAVWHRLRVGLSLGFRLGIRQSFGLGIFLSFRVSFLLLLRRFRCVSFLLFGLLRLLLVKLLLSQQLLLLGLFLFVLRRLLRR